MKTRHIADLLLLAAIWGGSFLFMRVAAPEFGAVALVAVRVVGAALFLVPILLWQGSASALKGQPVRWLVAGLLTSALPFLAFSFAALSITAGLLSIFNATTPLFAALIAWWWLGDRPGRARSLGLAIGFAGVLWLAWDKASFKPGTAATGWAVLACLVATLSYAVSATYTRLHFQKVPPLALAAGTQLGAAVFMVLPGLLWWPATLPSAGAWWAALGLAWLCTGLAYILFFRLLARVGPSNAISVTFLIPAFAVLWGWLFLGEGVTRAMMAGSAVILAGTALATGVLPRPRRPAQPVPVSEGIAATPEETRTP